MGLLLCPQKIACTWKILKLLKMGFYKAPWSSYWLDGVDGACGPSGLMTYP